MMRVPTQRARAADAARLRLLRVRVPRTGAFAAGLLALALTLGASDASALDAKQAHASAAQQVRSVRSGVGDIKVAISRSKGQERSAAQRIADAVLLMGAKDYPRASHVLNEVVEKHADHPTAYPDALALLGETYYRSKEYLSARRAFRTIVASSDKPRFASYQQKALARLVDIAVRTRDFDALDDVFAAMNRVPSSAATSGLAYARGKGLFAKKDYAGAKAALASVDTKSENAHQARYLLGLVAVKEAAPAIVALADGELPPPAPPTRYAAAIEIFRQATQLPADTSEHKRVVDLSWLAMGRLFYEADQWVQAVQAYNHIDRTSPEFGEMLYELAWVYVRLGDVDRAQRALEVLAIADPKSQNIGDGQLLRGDLMLRAGQFDKALKVYEGVRAKFDPMREKVDAFLGSTSDPAVYYDKLSEEQLDALDESSALPPLSVEWARDAEDGPAVFAVIDDVVQCRDLLKQSNELVDRLNAVLGTPNRVRMFPELKAGQEKALSLQNRIGLARLAVGQGMDDVESGALSGEAATWRARRRALEKRLGVVPVTDGDFQERDNQALKQWNHASQGLQRLNLQVDSLHAIINGLRRMLGEGPQSGVVRDPASVARFEQELAQNERDLALYRSQAAALRKMVEAGRVQVGFGDQRFVEDEKVRAAHREALLKEVELASRGAGGPSLAAYARQVGPVLREADAVDATLAASVRELDEEVGRRSRGVHELVARETANVVSYSVQLDALDGEARQVVGEVAMRNFGLVRDRLKNIVLRADVGITEQAWEVREEQVTRVRHLQVERSREDRVLREELSEVLDDSGADGEDGK